MAITISPPPATLSNIVPATLSNIDPGILRTTVPLKFAASQSYDTGYANAQIWAGSGVLNFNIPPISSAGTFQFNVGSTGPQISLGTNGLVFYNTNTTTLTGSNMSVCTTDGYTMTLNVPSACTFVFAVNAVSQVVMGLGGITNIASGLGTITAGNIQILSDAATNLSFQVPTGGQFTFLVNAVSVGAWSAASITLPSSSSFVLTDAGTITRPYSAAMQILGNTGLLLATGGGDMQFLLNSVKVAAITSTGMWWKNAIFALNSGASGSVIFTIDGNSSLELGQGGVYSFPTTGAITAGNIQIISTEARQLSFNVPTGGSYFFKSNNTVILSVSTRGVSVQNYYDGTHPKYTTPAYAFPDSPPWDSFGHNSGLFFDATYGVGISYAGSWMFRCNGATFMRMAGYSTAQLTCYVNTSTWELSYVTSSEKYKRNIVDMESVTDRLNALRPVRFEGTCSTAVDPSGWTSSTGLIAEEVMTAFPELAGTVPGPEGELVNVVHYDRLAIFLLKAWQQDHAELMALKNK